MANKRNWRGCSNVYFTTYGEWGGADIIYDGYEFEYDRVEGDLWWEFTKENNIEDTDENWNKYQEEFNKYCQKEATDYLDGLFASGYFGEWDDEAQEYEDFLENKITKKREYNNMIKIIQESMFDNLEQEEFNKYKDYYADKLASDIYNFYCDFESEIHGTGYDETSCVDWDVLDSEVSSYYGNIDSIKDKLLTKPDSVISEIRSVGYEYEKEGYDESVDYAKELMHYIEEFFK